MVLKFSQPGFLCCGFLSSLLLFVDIVKCFRITAFHYISGGDLNGTIWLDGDSCTGYETSIIGCNHRGWATHNCDHSKDVAIACLDAVEGDIRLGGNNGTGILEIFHNGIWGTVCDDGFGYNDALVVCRQLYPQLQNFEHVTSFTHGKGSGIIWLDDLYCNGNESSLVQCQHIGWGNHNCGHHEDIGIQCFNASYDPPIPQGGVRLLDIRLVDGVTPYDGHLEMFFNNEWRSVCSKNIGLIEAKTFCVQLAMGTEDVSIFSHSNNNKYDGILLDDLQCTFVETRVEQCYHGAWRNTTCDNNQHVGLKCHGKNKIGYWASWGSFEMGSALKGYQLRERRCSESRYDMASSNYICIGTPFSIRPCSEGYCEAQWSLWSPWKSCKNECSDGNQLRIRWCNNPPPRYTHDYCSGKSVEFRKCSDSTSQGMFYHTQKVYVYGKQKFTKTQLSRLTDCFS